MEEKYCRSCIEKNSLFRVYHGAGIYVQAEQNPVLHYDPELTVSYFKHCEGVIKIEGRSYPIQSGDVVLMDPNEIHCLSVKDGSFHERISLYVNRSALEQFPFDCTEALRAILDREHGTGNVIRSDQAAKWGIRQIAEDIRALVENTGEKSRVLCACRIVELLVRLSDAVSFPEENAPAFLPEDPLIVEVLKYIADHISTVSGCGEIAKELYISKHRLEHLFKECVGIPMWDYVILRRLLLFNDLILEEKTAKEAAFLCGFKNYSNFFRLYKKHMQLTPAEYKQQWKKQRPGA